MFLLGTGLCITIFCKIFYIYIHIHTSIYTYIYIQNIYIIFEINYKTFKTFERYLQTFRHLNSFKNNY